MHNHNHQIFERIEMIRKVNFSLPQKKNNIAYKILNAKFNILKKKMDSIKIERNQNYHTEVNLNHENDPD